MHGMHKLSNHKLTRQGTACVLLTIFVVGIGILLAPRLYAATIAYVYPPDQNILVHRYFEPHDFSAVSSGGAITVTLVVTNSEDVDLRGFYYSDQVPNGWSVNTTGVSVNGTPVADYTYGQGYADEIYTGFTPHRWALELPQGSGIFSPTHPIPASGGTAQIIYTMVVSGGSGSDYSLGHDGWAGWLETDPTGTAVFGYQVVTAPLNADFTADPRSGEVPLGVAFTDTSTGDPTSWAWDFGDDGSISSQQHPTHTYTSAGYYTVTLTITRTDPAGSDTVLKANFITVTSVTTPTLQADFTAQPRSGLRPLTVQFYDLSTGDIVTRVWDFGDGGGTALPPGTSPPPGPSHTYYSTGSYTVTLTVYDAYDSDTLVQPRYIHVTEVLYKVYLPVILKAY